MGSWVKDTLDSLWCLARKVVTAHFYHTTHGCASAKRPSSRYCGGVQFALTSWRFVLLCWCRIVSTLWFVLAKPFPPSSPEPQRKGHFGLSSNKWIVLFGICRWLCLSLWEEEVVPISFNHALQFSCLFALCSLCLKLQSQLFPHEFQGKCLLGCHFSRAKAL